MTTNIKNRTRILGYLFCVFATVLLTCETVPDHCGKGVGKNSWLKEGQFCFGDEAHNLCTGRSYNPLIEGCDPNAEVGARCQDGSAVPKGTPCGGYTLTTAVTPPRGGSITRNPPETEKTNFAADDQVVLIATPEDGYIFLGWAGAATSTNNEMAEIKMNGNSVNKPIVAMFKPKDTPNTNKYTLTATAFPEHGGDITRTPNAAAYDPEESVTLKVTAKPGYTFDGWSGDATSQKTEISVLMDGSKTLVAMFTPIIYKIKADANPEAGGAVFVNGTALTGDASRNVGTEIVVWARPADGYSFTGWSGAAESAGTNNPATINVTKDNLTITANFKKGNEAGPITPQQITHTLTTDVSPPNSGGISFNPDATTYGVGTPVTARATPAGGYKFTGWSGASNSTNPTVTITMDGDKTLTAGFGKIGAKTFTVTFNANGATSGSVPTVTADSGAAITLPGHGNMTKTGYGFGGWVTSASATEAGYAANTKYTVTNNVTLYALWIATTTYTVTFNGNGTTSGVPATLNTNYGNSVTLPSMTRTGYTFVEWNTNNSGTGTGYPANSSYIVAGNITLYARWTTMAYTVTFNGNSTTSGGPAAVNANHGNNITLPSMTRTGYTFVEWNTNSAGTGTGYAANSSYTVTGNVTLYAKWTAITYTVTFNGNGAAASDIPKAVNAKYDNSVTLPSMTRTGYTFAEWNTNNTGTGTGYAANSSYTVTGNVTLYAKWTPITYAVSFDGNGATSGVPTTMSVNYGNDITLPSMTRTGYRFVEWNTSGAGTGNGYPANSYYTVVGNVTLYARWTTMAFTVTFDGNGTTIGTPAAIDANYGDGVTLPTMERTGYTFGGWYVNRAGTGTNYSAGQTYTVTSDATLYAKWTAITYAVSFNGNGATAGVPTVMNATYGGGITLPGMTRTGHTFVEWNTNSTGTGTGYNAGQTYSVTNDATLYAIWRAQTHTVTFDGNGTTTGVPAAMSADYGNSVTLPTMTRTGHRFVEWNTNSAGTGNGYPANSYYTVVGNVTLYARWTTMAFTVTFDGNGTTIGTPAAIDANYGNDVTLPTMKRDGHTFGGWYENSAGTGTNYSAGQTYTVTKDAILYAKWTVINYTVTFNGNGTTSGVPTAMSAAYGNSITLPTMTRTGYTFDGWYENSAGTGTNYSAGQTYTVTNDATLYAKWTAINYTVTVSSVGTGASGGGSYVAGTTVSITAGTAPSGQRFKNWTITSGVTLANANSASTSFTMPANAVTVTAVFEAIPTYAVTVSGGTGGGNYAAGTTVSITAGTAPSGQQFKNWTITGGVTLANANSASTSFTMPANAVTVTAVFEAIPTYAVTVSGGTGGGNYAAGATVSITAGTAPSGQQFKNWTSSSSSVTFADANSVVTTFIMPANAVTVTANFETVYITDTRDGKKYRITTIGTQTWMAENLNYQPSTGNSWCYDNSSDSCAKYGILYTWDAAMTACPSGWHLPSRDEWDHLAESVGVRNGNETWNTWYNAGKALKSQRSWNDNGNGTDTYGFSALPGGVYDGAGDFYRAGNYGYWWTATENGSYFAHVRGMVYDADYVIEDENGVKSYGISVRCVKDD